MNSASGSWTLSEGEQSDWKSIGHEKSNHWVAIESQSCAGWQLRRRAIHERRWWRKFSRSCRRATTWLGEDEGQSISDNMEKSVGDMKDGLDSISSAQEDLYTASSEAKDVAAEEDDALDHGPDSAEYAAWEKRNSDAQEAVAKAASTLRAKVADHVAKAQQVLTGLDVLLADHAATHKSLLQSRIRRRELLHRKSTARRKRDLDLIRVRGT